MKWAAHFLTNWHRVTGILILALSETALSEFMIHVGDYSESKAE